jgi:hypothetical protein
MFSEVTEVWEWLCRLFEPNVLSYAIQYDYEKCPDRYSPEEWYVSFLQLKAEFFASDGVEHGECSGRVGTFQESEY